MQFRISDLTLCFQRPICKVVLAVLALLMVGGGIALGGGSAILAFLKSREPGEARTFYAPFYDWLGSYQLGSTFLKSDRLHMGIKWAIACFEEGVKDCQDALWH